MNEREERPKENKEPTSDEGWLRITCCQGTCPGVVRREYEYHTG